MDPARVVRFRNRRTAKRVNSNLKNSYGGGFVRVCGFGAQLAFQPDGSSQCFMTQHGDTFLLDRGYHPTVTSPGHEKYIFTIMVGKTRRGLVQNF